ncbi:MAG: S41 family peptidase [Myxococcota bacterium]|nr:PDZ domain-containing protein [Myxococcota bacterium]
MLAGLSACGKPEVIQSYPEQYVGVGIELTIEEHVPVVVRTLAGGSAQSVGVEPGDKLLAIDDKSTRDVSLGNAVMMMRGEAGSQVRLTIARRDQQLVVIVPRRPMMKGETNDYRAAN